MHGFAYEPSSEEIQKTNIYHLAESLSLNSIEELYRVADMDPEKFWPAVIKDCNITFSRHFDSVVDQSNGPPFAKWFVGGLINAEYNCVERWRNSEHAAIRFEDEEGNRSSLTYAELDRRTGKLAGGLKSFGIGKGDRVGIYMPLSPETITAMYAIMRIGAVAVPVFSGYAADAVQKRVEDAGISFLFTSCSYAHKGKRVAMIEIARRVRGIKLIVSGTESLRENEYSFEELLNSGEYLETVETSSEDPFIMLYTSGTTGKPKGTVHVHGGSFVNIVKEVKYYMDVHKEDSVFWITDLGWMMGPWYILGTHALGSTVFVYNGSIDYPDLGRINKLIENNSVTILGLSPTYVRMLKHNSFSNPLKGIRLIGSTGEPWDDEGWMYLFEKLGDSKTPIANISGGTDLIGCFLASTPAVPLMPRCLYRGLGMNVSVFDEEGNEIYDDVGYLVAKKACPSFTRSLWNQEEKYLETYWSKFKDVWFHGDWAVMTRDSYFFLLGRSDDVIKVAGKRVGPNEIEDAAMKVDGVRECAAIGVPDNIKGESIVIFYMGKEDRATEERITTSVESDLGKAFRPKSVVHISSLPRTRSGKIMRRVVRSAFLGLATGDVSNLENPDSVKEIVAIRSEGSN